MLWRLCTSSSAGGAHEYVETRASRRGKCIQRHCLHEVPGRSKSNATPARRIRTQPLHTTPAHSPSRTKQVWAVVDLRYAGWHSHCTSTSVTRATTRPTTSVASSASVCSGGAAATTGSAAVLDTGSATTATTGPATLDPASTIAASISSTTTGIPPSLPARLAGTAETVTGGAPLPAGSCSGGSCSGGSRSGGNTPRDAWCRRTLTRDPSAADSWRASICTLTSSSGSSPSSGVASEELCAGGGDGGDDGSGSGASGNMTEPA
mmetsp:Transcript_38290/g.86979  ORF Transcript_38290/g.86979 Transcript_38290/m.86979 type:complete len:264 (+) Transcript_38290:993-1784(+)